jgi:hypothetical protein
MNYHELRKNDDEFRRANVEIARKIQDNENRQLFRLFLALMALAGLFGLGIVGLLTLFTR